MIRCQFSIISFILLCFETFLFFLTTATFPTLLLTDFTLFDLNIFSVDFYFLTYFSFDFDFVNIYGLKVTFGSYYSLYTLCNFSNFYFIFGGDFLGDFLITFFFMSSNISKPSSDFLSLGDLELILFFEDNDLGFAAATGGDLDDLLVFSCCKMTYGYLIQRTEN